MVGFKSLVLAALMLLPAVLVHARMIDVAVKYDKVNAVADCSKYSAKLRRVSALAMYHTGVLGKEDEDHWQTYSMLHDRLVKLRNQIDKVNEKYNHATEGKKRQLGDCGGFCWFMCNSQKNRMRLLHLLWT